MAGISAFAFTIIKSGLAALAFLLGIPISLGIGIGLEFSLISWVEQLDAWRYVRSFEDLASRRVPKGIV